MSKPPTLTTPFERERQASFWGMIVCGVLLAMLVLLALLTL
jgi:hypothetical protein